jgi:hypothetical protein
LKVYNNFDKNNKFIKYMKMIIILNKQIILIIVDMTTKILKTVEGISRKVDDEDWTPLHLAAHLGHSALATLLLNDDKDVAYMKDKNGRTALHIAIQQGKLDIVKTIVSSCPDCCELVDNKGWNVLHFAINCPVYKLYPFLRVRTKLRLRRIIEIIGENPCLDNLLNEKNADGDAPLHYYLKKGLSAENFFGHPRLDKMAFNKKNLTAFEGAVYNWPIFRRKEVTHNFILHLKKNYLSVFQVFRWGHPIASLFLSPTHSPFSLSKFSIKSSNTSKNMKKKKI